MYDLFFVTKSESNPEYQKLKARIPFVKRVDSVAIAKKRAFTRYFWVVWEDTSVLATFDFKHVADDTKADKVMALKNTNGSMGICLISKALPIPEDEHRMFDDVHELDILASKSVANLFDIIFIDNGEPQAEENWEGLKRVSNKVPNTLRRVSGVNGRASAYKEAARQSETHCFFAVFAKLKINPAFDWSWTSSSHEDRHYVFNARNPVNGLVYGHQAIIAYNKELVLANPANEIDFTLAQSYQSIPLLSGTAIYNTSPMLAWRTAFREVLKLKLYVGNSDSNAADRMTAWLAPSEAPFGEWSQKGAQDAVDYFDTVAGDYSKLMLSYEWKWLNEYFAHKHSLAD